MPRYAIYFVPAAVTEFFRFGSAVLGYDCYTGANVERPSVLDSKPALWDRLTVEPRRYGFHATLKAPFHLSPSCTEAQLVSAGSQLRRPGPRDSGLGASDSTAQRVRRDRAGGGVTRGR